jgi:putative membrane-bound dehydrogenase-like protein
MLLPRFVLLLLLPFVSAAEPPAKPVAPVIPKGFHTTALNGHNFTLPDGFTIELVAASPLVNRPISASFDEKGRLYVTDSSGSNDKTAEQVKTKPHRIVRLEDTDGDGKFDKSTVFVKNVMFPEGAMWYRGSLYVAAPPHIWKFTDTDGDGIADKEEIWFDGKTVTGCANDLHGPWLGPDGWIYWTKGAFAKQEYTLANGKTWSTRASHIFRAKPDGTNIEPVMTGGMDNPVGLAFTPSGEPILCGTFFQHPADGKRDGILHAVYGGVWGKDHDPIYEHPWTSPQLMPMMTHLGPAAPAGMIRYQSDQFGKEYQDNLFCSQFNMRKVSRHVLVPEGSTYRTLDSDFVVSDNFDFHPTDVVEDADGSLLILDTGGWYKLCCPTSQLVKAEVLGAIYRVKKTGAHKAIINAIPKSWNAERDSTPIPPPDVLASLGTSASPQRGEAKSAAVLSLNSLPTTPTSPRWGEVAALRGGWGDCIPLEGGIPPQLRLVTANNAKPKDQLPKVHNIALNRDASGFDAAIKGLQEKDPLTRRLAAVALGRIGDPKAVPAIFDAIMFEKNDRFLEHALTYALIEIADPKATAAGLTHKYPHVRRAALTALDQMPNGKLEAKHVLAELDSKDAPLKETAWWIAGHHPEWGEQLAGRFAEQLKNADKATNTELVDRLVKFAKNEAVQKTLVDAVTNAPKAGKLLALQAMTKSSLKNLPEPWRAGLLEAVKKMDDHEVIRASLVLLQTLPFNEKDHQLFELTLLMQELPTEIKLSLLSARPPGMKLHEVEFLFLILNVFQRDGAASRCSVAADALVKASLESAQFVKLAEMLKIVGPLEFTKLLGAFAKSTNKDVGLALVVALSDLKVRPSVRLEQVKPIFDKYPAEVKAKAEKLYELLAEDRKEERTKLEKLAASLPVGDAKRGQVVFNGAKAACASCHKLGYVGGTLGPDLTRIGGIRSERDLLEAIVLPSASFVRSYEPFRVVTLDGKVFNGILKKDAPDEVVLAPAADQLVRIPRADIEVMTPSTVSVMPAGLDQQLSPQDLSDLVTFLKANTR